MDANDVPHCCSRPTECVDHRPGRYLTETYLRRTGKERSVPPGAISDALAVSPASVSERFTRLAEEGFVTYRKHEGVELAAPGRRIAQELVARQCAVIRYFERTFGTAIDPDVAFDVGYTLPRRASPSSTLMNGE